MGREGIAGLLFKRPEYVVAFRIVDERATSHPTFELEVPFHQYSAWRVGDRMPVYMNTTDGQHWNVSRV